LGVLGIARPAVAASANGGPADRADTGDPATTLAGAKITDGKSDTVSVFDTLPNWHVKGKMNAALTDGSACSMNTNDCLMNLMRPLPGK
jgi:hypothetical protein